jgi:hypothetical protein
MQQRISVFRRRSRSFAPQSCTQQDIEPTLSITSKENEVKLRISNTVQANFCSLRDLYHCQPRLASHFYQRIITRSRLKYWTTCMKYFLDGDTTLTEKNMKAFHRGIPYEVESTPLETSASGSIGKYRGAQVKFSVVTNQPQATVTLRYRGAAYESLR